MAPADPSSQSEDDRPPPTRRRWGRFAVLAALGVVLGAGWAWWRQLPAARDGAPPAGPGAVASTDSVPLIRARSWQTVDDPTRDGWASEVLYEQAKAQLHELARLLKRPQPLGAEDLRPLVAPDVVGRRIVPDNAQEVFQDSLVRVWRGKSTGEQVRGLQALGEALAALRAPYAGAQEVRAHFKVYQVSPDPNGFSTRQIFTFSGRTAEGMLEEHATWQIRWTRTGEEAPRIARVDVVDWERAATSEATLFSDCTASVLGANSSYRDQLLRGYQYWLGQLQETRYLAGLGNPGLAVGDVNGDGLDDLYVCQETGLPNLLFLQQADGTLRDVSADWEVDWLENSRSAILADLDNDGDQDLAVAVIGGVVVAENDAQKKFRLRAVLPTREDAMSLAAADYDQDARVDLYVCAYHPDANPASEEQSALAAASTNFVIHDANTGGANTLFKNEISPGGAWHFVDVTDPSGLQTYNQRFSLAAAWEDYDNDGDLDLYVANDFGRDNLYRNEIAQTGEATFRDVSTRAQVETAAAGMGVTWGDFDRDGWMDVYVSNMFSAAGNRVAAQPAFKTHAPLEIKQRFRRFSRGNTLLKNRGDGEFQDVTLQARVAMGRWAWGSRFVDFNNDGWEDLVVPNGYITAEDSGDL